MIEATRCLIVEGQAAGQIAQDDPDQLVLILISFFHGLSCAAVMREGKPQRLMLTLFYVYSNREQVFSIYLYSNDANGMVYAYIYICLRLPILCNRSTSN